MRVSRRKWQIGGDSILADILVDVKDESLRSNSLKSLRKLLKIHESTRMSECRRKGK